MGGYESKGSKEASVVFNTHVELSECTGALLLSLKVKEVTSSLSLTASVLFPDVSGDEVRGSLV